MARGCRRPSSIWRRAILTAGLCTLLNGCANAPHWAPWYKAPAVAEKQPAVPASSHAEEPRRPVHHAERHPQAPEPPAQVAMIAPDTLVGKKRSDVTRLIGAPARITKEEPSLVWIYEADGCALKIYFYPDLKTSAFHVLKFSLADADGKPLDEDAPCRRKLLAVRDHDTG